MNSDEFDVIICGAGPAGCTAALALGSSGLRIALVTKDLAPGQKACGDAIPAYIPKVLKTIDPRYSLAFEMLQPKVSVNTSRIIAPNGKLFDLKYPENGYICRRSIFDTFLLDLASSVPGLVILKGIKISDVRTSDDKTVLVTDTGGVLTSRMVIGCDGAHSITRRKLTHEKYDLRNCSIAVRAYFRNVKEIQAGIFELHFLKDYLPGYFWIFPLTDNQANVGLGMPADAVLKKKISLPGELLKITGSLPGVADRFKGAGMKGEIRGYLLPLGSAKTTLSGSRFMLCGDAASLADPATGAGIGQAMISGRYAGWHAAECFRKNDFSADFMKAYDKAVTGKLSRENRRRHLIRKTLFDHPVLFNSFMNLPLNNRFVQGIIRSILK